MNYGIILKDVLRHLLCWKILFILIKFVCDGKTVDILTLENTKQIDNYNKNGG